jgi:transcriptional regulator with XRE-family HTH domain
MSIFSENLRLFRSKKGESQAKLGSAVGKSRDAVAKYEIGENEPDLDTLTKFSRHFGVPIDSIVTNDEYIVLNSYPELKQFELYLSDRNFAPYLQLAAKIKDLDIDINDVENYVDSIAKYVPENRKGHKKKHP